MELSLSHTLHLFNIFCENDGKENFAQVLEEELHRMLGIEYVNDEHEMDEFRKHNSLYPLFTFF